MIAIHSMHDFISDNKPTLQNLGHFGAVLLFIFLLLISSLVSGNFTFASSQTRKRS